MAETDGELVGCMEVWGGNQPVDSGVIMAGLDAWVFNQPFGESQSGGDVYYVSSCGTGRITRLFVADVTGHGAVVARTSATLRTLMQQHVNHLDQGRFLRALNRQFASLVEMGCFATALVTTFFAPTNYLTVCNAGHPPPLLYRVRTKRWALLEQRSEAPPPASRSDAPSTARPGEIANLPLGIMDLSNYDQFGLSLHVGDLVLCYTDYLVESQDSEGRMLGKQGLLDIVRTLDASRPELLIRQLRGAIRSYANDKAPQDDVTLLLFRPNGMAPRVPWAQRVRAPLRLAGALLRSLGPKGPPMPWPDLSVPNIGGAMLGSLNRRWGMSRQPYEPWEGG